MYYIANMLNTYCTCIVLTYMITTLKGNQWPLCLESKTIYLSKGITPISLLLKCVEIM